MRRRVTLLAIAILTSLLPYSSILAQHESYHPDVGKSHPEIVLPRIDNGESVSLADYRGKKVLLIHFASW